MSHSIDAVLTFKSGSLVLSRLERLALMDLGVLGIVLRSFVLVLVRGRNGVREDGV